MNLHIGWTSFRRGPIVAPGPVRDEGGTRSFRKRTSMWRQLSEVSRGG